jgi:hypothetical protein
LRGELGFREGTAVREVRQKWRYHRILAWKWLIPELAAYEDELACIGDWKHVMKSVVRGFRGFVPLGGSVAVALLVLVVVKRLIESRVPGLANWIVGGLCGLLASALYPALCIWIFHRRMRRALHKRLLERGIRTCENCAYILGQQTEGRCPECGTPIPKAYNGA